MAFLLQYQALVINQQRIFNGRISVQDAPSLV